MMQSIPEGDPLDSVDPEVLNLMQALIRDVRPALSSENHQLIRDLNSVLRDINAITKAWCVQFLLPAPPVDPNAISQMDDYAKPLITLAEIFRRTNKSLISLASDIYRWGIDRVDRHCLEKQTDLHRGALHANYAITLFEQGKYKAALGWLHAAAKQDELHRPDVNSIYDSYAFSGSGIFGQWLDSYVLSHLPQEALAFVNNTLNTTHTNQDVKRFIGWMAGRGDLHIIASLLEYVEADGKDDFHADSVRLSVIRDLATLTEVLIKQIGSSHKDAAVRKEFEDAPTFAGLICHMHFTDKLKDRRRNPALNLHREPGLFHNPLLPNDAILDAIDSGIDYCAGKTNNVHDVWNYLQATTLSADPFIDGIAKRMLLAYKLRNTTSHGFAPTDSKMKAHYADFRLWLLQSVFILYFWAKDRGYASI